MKQYIKAEIQHLGEDEILKMVPPDTLARLKETDPKPVIKAFCVGHEGTADAQEVGFGRRLFNYVQDAIIKLSDRLHIGTAIFNRHAPTNNHEGRETIGELVGKTLKTIGGKLSTIAAIYIKPQYRSLPLDVASIEANIEYSGQGKEVKVEDITNVTGIALSSSAIEAPGFPGATLLGAIQAFSANHTKVGEKMTLEELKDAVKEGKVKPSQLFSAEDLQSDSVVIEHVKKEKQTEYEHAKRVEKKLGEERDERMKTEKSLNDKIAELSGAVVKSKSDGVFKNLATERKLDDKQQAFINKNFGSFKTEAKDDETLKVDLNKFIDTQLVAYDEVAKILGVKKEDPKGPDGKGAPAGDKQDGEGSKDDLTDPKNNDFIPGAE